MVANSSPGETQYKDGYYKDDQNIIDTALNIYKEIFGDK